MQGYRDRKEGEREREGRIFLQFNQKQKEIKTKKNYEEDLNRIMQLSYAKQTKYYYHF